MGARNILIVMADQLTPFMVGCYGNGAVKTPHMDRLASEGVRYDAAYTNSPLCTPGRYAFMTGQYISRFGGWDNAAYLPSTVPTFAHYLRMMGYRTGLAGKAATGHGAHHVDFSLALGQHQRLHEFEPGPLLWGQGATTRAR